MFVCVYIYTYIPTYVSRAHTLTHGVSVVYMRPGVCNRGACNYAVIAACQFSLSAQLHRGPAVTDIEDVHAYDRNVFVFSLCIYITCYIQRHMYTGIETMLADIQT